jgi:hypothetical protein
MSDSEKINFHESPNSESSVSGEKREETFGADAQATI